MEVKSKRAEGVLKEILDKIDEVELTRIRKRMMLAVKISEAMIKCGYSKEQFAHLMNKDVSIISDWLSGDENFTINTLMDIENILGIKLLNV